MFYEKNLLHNSWRGFNPKFKGEFYRYLSNGNFESWTYNIWTEDPTFWFTSNSDLLASTVVKDSNSYSGFIAMNLIILGKRHQITFDKNNGDDYIVELNTSGMESGMWILNIRKGKESYSTMLVID